MKNKTNAWLVGGLWISLNLIFVVNGMMSRSIALQIMAFLTPCLWLISFSYMTDMWREFATRLTKNYTELSSAYRTLYNAFMVLKQEEISKKLAKDVDKRIMEALWKPNKKSRK